MATLTADPRTATYEDVELFIYKQAHKFARQFGKDIDECISVANEGFLKCYDDFDADRGHKFITVAGQYAWNEMRNHFRSERKHDKLRATEDMSQHAASSREAIDIDELSADARHAAMLALDPPSDLAERAKEKGGHGINWRSTIREYLIGLGWAAARVAESFEEIRQILSR